MYFIPTLGKKDEFPPQIQLFKIQVSHKIQDSFARKGTPNFPFPFRVWEPGSIHIFDFDLVQVRKWDKSCPWHCCYFLGSFLSLFFFFAFGMLKLNVLPLLCFFSIVILKALVVKLVEVGKCGGYKRGYLNGPVFLLHHFFEGTKFWSRPWKVGRAESGSRNVRVFTGIIWSKKWIVGLKMVPR